MKIGAAPLDPLQGKYAPGVGAERRAAESVAGGGLDAGQLLKGRVLSVDPQGTLTVATDFGLLKAASTTVLPVGRELWLQVAQGGSNPLLIEAGKAHAVLNLLRVVLPGLVNTGEAAGQEMAQGDALRSFWEAYAMDGQPDPVKLAKTMALVGQGQPVTEGKSALALAAELKGLPVATAQKVAHLVEAHGAVNQSGGGAVSGSDYLLFPVFFAEQAGKGEWLFSFDRQGEGGDAIGDSATLSFYLVMSRLGDVHISLASQRQTLSGVITLASDAAAEHVRERLPLLIEAAQAVMGGRVSITCRCGPANCLKALKDDLTARLGQVDHYALIDIRT